MNGNGKTAPRVRGSVLGGPTIRVTVEMQVQDRAAHWEQTVRLAPGSSEQHQAIVAELARKAVRDLAVHLAMAKVTRK